MTAGGAEHKPSRLSTKMALPSPTSVPPDCWVGLCQELGISFRVRFLEGLAFKSSAVRKPGSP